MLKSFLKFEAFRRIASAVSSKLGSKSSKSKRWGRRSSRRASRSTFWPLRKTAGRR